MSNQKVVEELYLDNCSPYQISISTDIGIKEVYHYVKLSVEAKNRHKEALKREKELV